MLTIEKLFCTVKFIPEYHSLDYQFLIDRYVCETLRVMCATVAHNRIMACHYDVISSIIELLESSRQLPKHILSE